MSWEFLYQKIMFLCPQLCLLAIRAVFENKRAPKRALKGHFFKSLKVPHNGIIKTLCAKNEFVSPSVWLVARTEELQKIKKKILENGRKRALKGPKIQVLKNKKLRFFLMSQGVLCQKIRFLGQKLWPVAGEHTDTHTHRGFKNRGPYQGFSFSSFCLWYERSYITLQVYFILMEYIHVDEVVYCLRH